MSHIQVFHSSAAATVRFLGRLILKRFGAMSLGLQPCSHLECQKVVLLPSPKVIVVQAAKRRLSVLSHGVFVPTQTFPSDTHSCHSHRILRALANLSRFITPKPPFSLGMAHVVQLTLHFPPVSVLSPAHINFFRTLSRSSRISLGAFRTDRRYTGSEESTDFVKQVRPACVRCRPCQPASLEAALSRKGWKSAFCNLCTVRGSPRYFMGKLVH
ncbi:hypothetical protein PVAP13_5NG105340 [Panicum virgatum]|uniref:Uncharacterized protein n=1 Tax=Panicum virgatum TaxID=38727 RepID=A0A8T0RYX3_PANVG|nr:hypothetical protein PVAP13_5NG105340 [Panicum virgatum]